MMGKELVIFVVGNSRSGTTMMSRILGFHPHVFSFEELHFFEQLWNPDNREKLSLDQARVLFSRLLTIQRDGYLTQGQYENYRNVALEVLGDNYSPLYPNEIFQLFLNFETSREGGFIPCEQTPRNVYYIKEILELFPSAYVLNMIRDPRDVLLSQKNKWRRRMLGGEGFKTSTLIRFWSNYHPITISLLWKSGIEAAARFIDSPRVFNVKFEDVIASPEWYIKELCNNIGLEFFPEMIRIPQVGSSIENDEPEKFGINPSTAGRWKRGGLDSSEIYLCQKILADNLESYGYEVEYIRPNLFFLLRNIFLFPIKSLLAFIFNLNRMGNILDTIRRRIFKSG